jgi:hypothetical protein
MSEYLLNIAARNTTNNSNELSPSASLFNEAKTGVSEGLIEKNDIQNNAMQNKFFHQGIDTAQTLTPQNAQLDAVLIETEKGLTNKNFENSYFSKHIERGTAEKENRTLNNKTVEKLNFEIGEGTSNNILGNTGDKKNEYEQIFASKSVSKFLPEKKDTKKRTSKKTYKRSGDIILSESFPSDKKKYSEKKIIQPADKRDESEDKKITLSNNLRIERIAPNQPEQLSKIPVQNNKMNEATPKLIIGKITVEILPPKLPVPQKIITRVVQSSSKNSFSKANKLSFGLGQL